MVREPTRDVVLSVANWGCVGGFIVSVLGAYVPSLANLDAVGAGLSAIVAVAFHAR